MTLWIGLVDTLLNSRRPLRWFRFMKSAVSNLNIRTYVAAIIVMIISSVELKERS